jgi:hypothetical protein
LQLSPEASLVEGGHLRWFLLHILLVVDNLYLHRSKLGLLLHFLLVYFMDVIHLLRGGGFFITELHK